MASQLLLDWLVRASLLLVIVLPAVRLIERRSATAAHRLLAALFGSILVVLPVSMTAAPGWQWRIPLWEVTPRPLAQAGSHEPADSHAFPSRSPEVDDTRTHPAADSSESEHIGDVAAHPTQAITDSSVQIAADSGAAEPSLPAAVVPDRSSKLTGRWHAMTWPALAAAIWLAVAALLAMRLVRSISQLRRIVADTKPASCGLANHVLELSGRHGIKRPVQVLICKHGSMPLACWIGRWAIVLPADFESWSAELQKITLLHELGHVARRDSWVDYLAHSVLCIMWPNPLAWLAAADTRRLRERACDEWSLARCGNDAKTYALSLVEIVRRCQPQAFQAACAIADYRGFESRVKWLFSCPASRRYWGALSAPITVITLGLAVTIATAQPTEGPRKSNQQETTERALVTVSQEPSPETPALSVSGEVKDLAGNPLAGATVVLRANLGGVQYAPGLQHARDVLARTKTDSLGRYEFSSIGLPPRLVDSIDELRQGKPGAQVLAWADNTGLQWKPLSTFLETNVDFRLEGQADVSGIASDTSGETLEEGVLTVVGFTKATDTMDGFLNDPGDLNTIHSEVQFSAPIRNGRFSVPNMPQDYRVSVRVESQAGHRAFFVIDTGSGDFKQIKYRNAGRESIPVHRTPIHVTADQHPYVRVRVVDAHGNPVSGGGVQAVDSERHYGGSAAVDGNGTALLIVNSPGLHEVYFASDPLSPTVGVVQQVDIQPERGGIVTMKLPAPRLLRGRIIDGDTGDPVPGVYVAGGSADAGETIPRATGSMTVSGLDGRFELPVTEGVCRLSIRHEVDGYFVPTYGARRDAGPEPDYPTVTVDDQDPPEEVVMEVGRGLVVTGKVIDEQGKPAVGVKVLATSEGAPYRQTAAITDADGAYEVAGLSPYVPTRIAAWSESGAAEEKIAPVKDHPWEKTLEKNVPLKLVSATSVVGRVTLAGRPVAGVSVRLRRAGPPEPGEQGVRFSLAGETETDSQGQYQLSGLTKGDRYYLDIEPLEGAEVRDWRYTTPYSHTVDVENGETIELPDAELKSNGQTLTGVVVDPEGNPVEGITVSALLASGNLVSRPLNGPPPWTETDDEGRFRLTHLPDEPISLMAYKRNPAGGRILHPSHASPEMNASDIRIVFDPSLLEEPEDLD